MSEVKEPTRDEQLDQFYAKVKEQFGPGAPDKAEVEKWKAANGRVKAIPFANDELYFVRPVKRNEYRSLIEMAQKGGAADPESYLKELLVNRCVLWPKLDTAQMASTYAGTIESLYAAIMTTSNFTTVEELLTWSIDL